MMQTTKPLNSQSQPTRHTDEVAASTDPGVILKFWRDFNASQCLVNSEMERLAMEKLAPRVPGLKAIMFDVDGVLLNDVHLGAIFDLALRNSGLRVGPGEICLHGKIEAQSGRIEQNLQTFLGRYQIELSTEEALAAISAAGHQIGRALGSELTAAFSVDGLAQLGRVFPLGLATSKTKPDLLRTLETLGISEYFRAIVTREDVPADGSDLKGLNLARVRLGDASLTSLLPEEVLYIGDMSTDGKAAAAAGMPFAGVIAPMDRASLVESEIALMKAGAIAVFPHTDALINSILKVAAST